MAVGRPSRDTWALTKQITVPDVNRMVLCRETHAEILDLETREVWQSHGPISAEAYRSLELPSAFIRVGLGTGVMDAHYFRRSPGAIEDGPVSTREIDGHLFIHCANPPAGKPETPFGEDPKRLWVDKYHSLIFEADREISVISDSDDKDYVQVVAVSPQGGSVLQGGSNHAKPLALPSGWSLRTEYIADRMTIDLPHPTEAWFFANGASFQGPVQDFSSLKA